MPESNATNSSGEQNDAESSTKKDELRVKNVSELNKNASADTCVNATPAQPKRKLPAWMLTANSSAPDSQTENGKLDQTMPDQTENEEVHSSKRPRADQSKQSDCQENSTHSLTADRAPENEEKVNVSDFNAADTPAICTNFNIKSEPVEISASQNVPDSNVGNATTNANVKDNSTENDNAASTSIGIQNTNDIKPAVKVEKADASSTSRESCKYGIRCYRRNPMHRIEEAHPGDHDYKRPQFPIPPLGTPDCPYGNSCYRRNPTHFQLYAHPPDTDFQKNYLLRKRRRQQQQQQNNTIDDNSDLDDYDLDDPFINDDSDLDYEPSNDEMEDTEELDYDDCDKAEE